MHNFRRVLCSEYPATRGPPKCATPESDPTCTAIRVHLASQPAASWTRGCFGSRVVCIRLRVSAVSSRTLLLPVLHPAYTQLGSVMTRMPIAEPLPPSPATSSAMPVPTHAAYWIFGRSRIGRWKLVGERAIAPLCGAHVLRVRPPGPPRESRRRIPAHQKLFGPKIFPTHSTDMLTQRKTCTHRHKYSAAAGIRSPPSPSHLTASLPCSC